MHLLIRQSSSLDILIGDRGMHRDKTLRQLILSHLEGEEGDRHLVIHRHIKRHGEGKCGLTHRRTSGKDNQVRRLPAKGDLIQIAETGIDATHTVLPLGSIADLLQGIGQQLLDGLHLVAIDPLSNIEELLLRVLQEIAHPDLLVEGVLDHPVTEGDKVALHHLIVEDARVVRQIGGAIDDRGKRSDIAHPPDRAERTIEL